MRSGGAGTGDGSGVWVFTGTRIPLLVFYDNLLHGATIDEFVEWYPAIGKDQILSYLNHKTEYPLSEFHSNLIKGANINEFIERNPKIGDSIFSVLNKEIKYLKASRLSC